MPESTLGSVVLILVAALVSGVVLVGLLVAALAALFGDGEWW